MNQPVKFGSTCTVCGQPVQRLTRRSPWKHKRPQPSGAPHDHKAVAKQKGSS